STTPGYLLALKAASLAARERLVNPLCIGGTAIFEEAHRVLQRCLDRIALEETPVRRSLGVLVIRTKHGVKRQADVAGIAASPWRVRSVEARSSHLGERFVHL